MRLRALRYAGTGNGRRREPIALKHNHTVEEAAKGAGSRQPAHACADYDCGMVTGIGHGPSQNSAGGSNPRPVPLPMKGELLCNTTPNSSAH